MTDTSSSVKPETTVAEMSGGVDGTTTTGIFDPMFSAASFYDVLTAPAAPATPSREAPPARRPAVVAFYGFRGGAGRTIALAHVASILAQKRLKVAAIDLDLEAPGLPVALGGHDGVGGDEVEPRGLVALLRAAFTTDIYTPLRVVDHVDAIKLPDGSSKVWVLSAGRISRWYLAAIEELGQGIWHSREPPQPLQRVLEELCKFIELDVVFIDCRTGFSGLSASVLFHVADLVVTFFPLSDQIWDGLSFLLEAASVARAHRGGRPDFMLVPAMVPPGDAGRVRLDAFLPRLSSLYEEKLGATAQTEADIDEQSVTPWLADAIRYDAAVAAAGRVDPLLEATSWALFRPLADAIAERLGIESRHESVDRIDAAKILEEMTIDRRDGFAEEVEIDDLIKHFVAPEAMANLVDRSTALVVGAKGAGKTWLWRYLVENSSAAYRLPEGVQFIVGHSSRPVRPDDLHLSADALKEIERDAKMEKYGSHKAFWYLYAFSRLVQWRPALGECARSVAKGPERLALRKIVEAASSRYLQAALTEALHMESVATLAEALLAEVDRRLLQENAVVSLAYDGLDTGFDVGRAEDSASRRDRFVVALLQVLSDVRSRLRRISLKVFLREDIYLNVTMQNKSHLEAAKMELRWRSIDLWRIALNVAATSRTYIDLIQRMQPGIGRPWPGDESTLKALLIPLWGSTVDGTNRTKTANYVEKRITDAADRLFPRTLVQLLDGAIRKEREVGPPFGQRVLRYGSLKAGLTEASAQRVDALKKEYVELAPYLDALVDMSVTGTEQQFIEHIRRRLRRMGPRKGTKTRYGAEAGALHAGPAGWKKVLQRLKDVGVLGEYDKHGKLVVALLYRAGLKVKAGGF